MDAAAGAVEDEVKQVEDGAVEGGAVKQGGSWAGAISSRFVCQGPLGVARGTDTPLALSAGQLEVRNITQVLTFPRSIHAFEMLLFTSAVWGAACCMW